MTVDFSNMLHLFACGALGTEPNPNLQYNFGSIYNLAAKQQVSPVVYLSVAKLKKEYGVAVDDGLFAKWTQQFLGMIAFSVKRGRYIADLVHRLDSAGITNCILKGDVLSPLYHEPDSRISSDVDLWIVDKKRIPEAMDMMREDGFTVAEISEESHQIECSCKKYGLIELHTDFCDRIAKKIWFKNKVHLSEKNLIDIPYRHGGIIHGLSYTDCAIHLTMHFIKHFLSHGCGCRQLMDMLLYLSCNEAQIDWNRYNGILAELGYTKLIDICKKTGTAFLGLPFEQPSAQELALCEGILTDMETGGVFGFGEAYRTGFFYAVTKKKTAKLSHKLLYAKQTCMNAFGYLVRHKFNPFAIRKDMAHRKATRSTQEVGERLDLLKGLEVY